MGPRQRGGSWPRDESSSGEGAGQAQRLQDHGHLEESCGRAHVWQGEGTSVK